MRERLVSPAVIKIAAIVLAIKELWLLMGIPSFADTVISFFTIGAIPGTDRTLTPDETYRLLIGVFVIFVLLVFRKEIVNLFRRSHRPVQPEFAIEAAAPIGPPQMPLDHPLAMLGVGVVEEPASKIVKAPRKPISIHTPAFVLSAVALAGAKWLVAKQWIVAMALVAWQKAKIAARHLVITARLVGRTLLRVALLIIIVIADMAVVLWRMAEPHIRRFDTFLEKKTHEIEFTRTALSVGTEMIATARKWGANVKAAYDKASTPKQHDDQ